MQVRLDVVYAEERHAKRKGQTLRGVQAHQQRTRQPWTIRHSHGVDLPDALHGLRHHAGYLLDVRAARHLGHDAAVGLVQRYLRVHHARKHLAPVPDDRARRLVAARLYTKYRHSISTKHYQNFHQAFLTGSTPPDSL